ncbi:MAG: toll/interleukin-1 receptor domain-containing protein [Pseudomonadota bacterium]
MSAYQAFICHSREDRQLAVRLKRELEALRLPRSADASARIGRLYRDPEERPSAAALSERALDALDLSDALVVLCSRASAQSDWVEMVIRTFQRLGLSSRIVPVIVGDAPADAMPKALRDAPAPSIDARDDLARALPRIAARLTGGRPAAYERAFRWRKVRQSFLKGAAGGLAVLVLGASILAQRDAGRLELAETARTQAAVAQYALDRGDERQAIAAIDAAFPGDFSFAKPTFIPPREALVALTRVGLETRALIDAPLPALDVTDIRLLSEGVAVAKSADGSVHVIDLAAGAVETAWTPPAPVAARLSPGGETLWTARVGEEAVDENGDPYAPLIFENVDIATGEATQLAIAAVPPPKGKGAISPDGTYFAVDIGQGASGDRLVVVLHREATALAGLLALPVDLVKFQFAGSDALVLTAEASARAPSLFHWRIGDARPRNLSLETGPRACRWNRRTGAIDILSSPDHRYFGVLITGDEGSCVRRWFSDDSSEAEPLIVPTAVSGARLLSGDRVALFGAQTMIHGQAGERILAGCQSAPTPLTTGDGYYCGDALFFSNEDEPVWRGSPVGGEPLAVLKDPDRRRLYVFSAEGRLRSVDTAPRSWFVNGLQGAQLVATSNGGVHAISAEGVQHYSADGAVIPASDAAPIETPNALCNMPPTAISSNARTFVVAGEGGVRVYDTETCATLMTTSLKSDAAPLLPAADRLWLPRRDGAMIMPLALDHEAALSAIRARARGLRLR